MARKAHREPRVAAPHGDNLYNYFEAMRAPDADPSAPGQEEFKKGIVSDYATAKQVVEGVYDVMSGEFSRSLSVEFGTDEEEGIKRAVIDYLAPRFETKAPGEPTPKKWLGMVRGVQALQERVLGKEEQIMASPEFAALRALSHEDRKRQLRTFETLRGLKNDKGDLRFFKGMGAKSDPTSRWRQFTDTLFRSKEEQDALDVFMMSPDELRGGMGRKGEHLDALEEAHEALQNVHDLERLRVLRTQLFDTFMEATGIHKLAMEQVDKDIVSLKRVGGVGHKERSKNQAIIGRLQDVEALDRRGIHVQAEYPTDERSVKRGRKEVASRIQKQHQEIAEGIFGDVKRQVATFEFHDFGDGKTLLGELQKELARYLNIEVIGTVEGNDRLAFFAELFDELAKDKDVLRSKAGREKVSILRDWARKFSDDHEKGNKKE